jgi:carbon monoxide dehydrogenase subunit G
MLVEAQVNINAPKTAIWAVMTDIENAATILKGVEKIEVIEKPAEGLVGMRWRETRMYFGKPATVEKRIIDAVENEFYKTTAEDSGFVFLATMSISESGSGVTLTSSHDTQPQGFIAKLKSTPMFLFKGILKKALSQDLNDIKTAVEQKSSITT